MSKCEPSCTTFKDVRTGESLCYNHGTANFVRQSWDSLDESDKVNDRYVPKERIVHALKTGWLLPSEIAREFGVSEKAVDRIIANMT